MEISVEISSLYIQTKYFEECFISNKDIENNNYINIKLEEILFDLK